MSSQRLSRKEIKHEIRDDAFRHSVEASYDYVRGHRRNLLLGIGGVVLLALAVLGFRTWQQQRESGAGELLGQAIKVTEAPVVASGAKPDDPDAPSFADEKSRDARARQLLEKLESDYSGTGSADVGKVYLARLALLQGKVADARKLWQSFLDDHPDHMLAAAVRLSLLDLDRKDGKAERVVERLRADLDKDEKPLPEDVMLYELGETLEQLGRRQEAKDAYQRVADEYPDSAWASKAQTKVRELAPPGNVG
ncbi:MAG TPA: tetratricopeptide repeat protein [Thermoanaerobaculia bacterium]|jgi:predicted negative regulator of RcsB-dependent stress response|nr:tetratricopeptide repeat protein [Thermoanaerobaculia bacterium]